MNAHPIRHRVRVSFTDVLVPLLVGLGLGAGALAPCEASAVVPRATTTVAQLATTDGGSK